MHVKISSKGSAQTKLKYVAMIRPRACNYYTFLVFGTTAEGGWLALVDMSTAILIYGKALELAVIQNPKQCYSKYLQFLPWISSITVKTLVIVFL